MKFTIPIVFLFIPFKFSGQFFEVFVDNKKIEVSRQNDVSYLYGLDTYKYARITFNGIPKKIRVKVSGFTFGDSDWSISPKRYNIEGKKFGNSLLFDINRLGYVVIKFSQDQDFKKNLVLLVEHPQILPIDYINIVEKYKVDNSGKINETFKIQKALNDISCTEKVLFFPDGIYKTYMLRFKSNSKIFLSRNARIIADPSSLNTYLENDSSILNRFLLIEDSENIEISGLGILDGNGTQISITSNSKLLKSLDIRLILINRSKNIKFNGILLKDSARWNTHILESDNVSFTNCKLMNNPNENLLLGSLDGWDPDSSSNILIENCFGWAGDDTVAIKCTGLGIFNGDVPIAKNIKVIGNVFLTKKTALKIGTETFCSTITNVFFENNEIIESDRAFGINVRDGATVKKIYFKNNYIEYCYPDRKQMGMNFYITKRIPKSSKLGRIKKIFIEDCFFEKSFPNKMSFYRHYSATKIYHLKVNFKNLYVGKEKIDSISNKYFDRYKNNGSLIFR